MCGTDDTDIAQCMYSISGHTMQPVMFIGTVLKHLCCEMPYHKSRQDYDYFLAPLPWTAARQGKKLDSLKKKRRERNDRILFCHHLGDT